MPRTSILRRWIIESGSKTFIRGTASHYRHARGWTQEELADHAGISPYSVSGLERGMTLRPQQGTVVRLSDALQLDSDERAALLAARRQALPIERTPNLPRHLSFNDDVIDEMPVAGLTPFIGREKEIATLCGLLTQREARMITICGTVGVGKTRLALEVAHIVAATFQSGVHTIPLAPLRSNDEFLPAIARALGMRASSKPSLESEVIRRISGKEMLLLLDNAEHVASASGLLTKLLTRCPRLYLLITSRAALGVRAEREFALDPLPVPDVEGETLTTLEVLQVIPAVALFVDRVRAIVPGFQLTDKNALSVAALCRRMDGLPLAIELIAPHVRLFSPQELLHRLERSLPYLADGPRDLPGRQRSLRDALDWSYDLLSEDTRDVFQRLGVFRGGAPLDAVEALATAGMAHTAPDSIRVLGALREIAAHNLARREHASQDTRQGDEEVRIGLLETVREYAEERLMASKADEGATRYAHATWYLSLVETASSALSRGEDQAIWMTKLECEWANLAAAFAWVVERGREDARAADMALRLAIATCRFWLMRGPLETGRNWLECSLALMANIHTSSNETRAAALHTLGTIASDQGDLLAARSALEGALHLRRALGDVAGSAATLNNLGLVELAAGAPAIARLHFVRAMILKRRLGNMRGVASTLNNVGLAHKMAGDHGRAILTLAAVARRARLVDDDELRAYALANYADALHQMGNLVDAEAAANECLSIRCKMGDRHGLGQVTGILGSLAEARGNTTTAMAHYREALRNFHMVGAHIGILEALTAIALLRAGWGEYLSAVRLLAAIAVESHEMGATVWDATRQAQVTAVLNSAHTVLGEACFAKTWAEGERLLTRWDLIDSDVSLLGAGDNRIGL